MLRVLAFDTEVEHAYTRALNYARALRCVRVCLSVAVCVCVFCIVCVCLCEFAHARRACPRVNAAAADARGPWRKWRLP